MSAETALRHLLDEFDFDVEELLKAGSMHKHINIRFSNLEYGDFATAVGLRPILAFSDAPLFDLRRSRIPTPLFKKIVEDIDASLIHYGALKPCLGERQLIEEKRDRVSLPLRV